MRLSSLRDFTLGRISFRIFLIGFVGLAGVVTVSAAYWRLQSRVAAGVAEQASLSVIENYRAAIATAVPQLLIRELTFLATRDQAEVSRHAEVMAQAMASANALELASDALGKIAHREKDRDLRSALAAYDAMFKRLASLQIELGLSETLGHEGKLRKAVHEIEQLLNTYDQPRLAVLMLMMRRHEKDFMLRHRVSYGDEITRRVASFRTLLDASAIPSSERQLIHERLTTYHETFKAYMASSIDLATTRAASTAAYAAIEPPLRDLNTAIQSDIAASDAALADELAALSRLVWWVIAGSCAAIVFLGILIGRSISRPLNSLTAAIGRLGSGDLDVTLPARERRDELGDMAVAIESFRGKLVAKAREEFEREQGQERQQATIRRQEANRLADRFQATAGGIVAQVAGLASQLAGAAGGLTQSAGSTQQATRQVAISAGEVAANAGTMARATEEMSHAIAEIDTRVGQASTVASAATFHAQDAESIGRELMQSAEQVSDIVSLIRSIAEQTNLLALNATIEAARAGDAGRGFAVVASEVKSLAAQTATATATIASHVEAMKSAAGRSVAGMDGIVQQVIGLSEIATAISAAVAQQRAATGEISRDVQYLASAAEAVSGKIIEVSDQAAMTGTSAEQLANSAAELSSGSRKLDDEVREFLKAVRAA